MMKIQRQTRDWSGLTPFFFFLKQGLKPELDGYFGLCQSMLLRNSTLATLKFCKYTDFQKHTSSSSFAQSFSSFPSDRPKYGLASFSLKVMIFLHMYIKLNKQVQQISILVSNYLQKLSFTFFCFLLSQSLQRSFRKYNNPFCRNFE